MKCEDIHQILPEAMDGVRDAEFQTHLAKCTACSELVSDLELISIEAHQLAESAEPSPRVWLAIAAELRAEGLIREPEPQRARPLPARSRRNAWWLVPVAAAVIAAGSYVVKPKPVREVAQVPQQQEQSEQQATVVKPQPPPETPTLASTPRTAPNPSSELESASADDQQFLQEVSTRAPGQRANYENELRAVNSYLSDARAYVKQHPEDEDARQHLMEAYEQKAMLYQMALNHVQ